MIIIAYGSRRRCTRIHPAALFHLTRAASCITISIEFIRDHPYRIS